MSEGVSEIPASCWKKLLPGWVGAGGRRWCDPSAGFAAVSSSLVRRSRTWFYMMCHVEGYKAPSTWKCMKMIACEPKIFIGYKIHFFTDCYKEIIILHKWTCTEIMTYPKTLFSSKSWRSFSKERLHSTDTCHCSILRNIKIWVH